jgi:hypothetical protein
MAKVICSERWNHDSLSKPDPKTPGPTKPPCFGIANKSSALDITTSAVDNISVFK